MTLAEPAGTLWRQVRDTIGRELTDPQTNDACYELGGGSILASRWGHRASFDIDLTTTDPKGLLQETVRTQQGLAASLCGELTPRSNPRHVTMGAFPISRSRAHTHRRHGHPLQTVPSAGLIERPQEKNRVDALR